MTIKRLLKAMVLPMLLFMFNAAFAQEKTVTGKVTDSKAGTGLAGVSVTVKSSKVGTQTGSDGSYTLKVPAGATTLVISSAGFAAQEMPIGNGPVDVALVQTATNLNEVVVIAYGSRRKSDLTGSVTSVGAKDFQKGNIPSSEQLLQGKVAGLQITNGGGQAGGGSRIRIRGGASLNASNDPLIVIDGVPVDGNGVSGTDNLLGTINPNDIESMSVLKDASATALYGSRASNGVLIITTKKGAKGKTKFNFNTQFSLADITKYVKVLDADQVRNIVNADALSTGINIWKNSLGTANTNWQSQIYQVAPAYDNNISASGSLGNIPYRASLGVLNQDGTLKRNHFDRVSSSLNLTPKFLDNHLAITVALKYSHVNNNFSNPDAIGSAIAFNPTQPVYAANKYGGYYETLQADGKPLDLAVRNPVGLINQRENISTVNRFIGNVMVDYKLHFFPDLHVMANFGADISNGTGNNNYDSLSATNYKTAGSFSYYKQGKRNWLSDVSLFYTKDLKSINSKFDLLVGHVYQDFITNNYSFASYSQAGTVLPNSTPVFATDKPEYRLESYIGRLNYTYNDKYLLTASIRRDASSKFSPENRVGYFPAAAFAWKMKEEFLRNSKFVSELKLRLGWGITGQQDGIGYYNYLPVYSPSVNGAQYQFGNTFYSFLRPGAYDPNLKWETTTTSNIGIDYGFLRGRISGSIDVYMKKTKDLLSTVPVAPGANFDIALTTNVGNIENKGIEFTVNTIPVQTKDFNWSLGFNVTYNETKITNLLKNADPNFTGIDVSTISGGTGNNIGRQRVGYSPYTFYMYKQVYDKTTGKPIEGLYEDINRDGKVDENDRYFYKKPAPDFLLGLSTSFEYKKFTLGFAAHGSVGGYIYNNYKSGAGVINSLKNPLGFVANASVNYLETGFINNRYISDYYIENASFIRLDNINLGYNVGKVFRGKASLRVQGSVQNVFVVTKYGGLDPENSSDNGIDNNIYPRPRIYSVGASLDF